MRSPRPVRAGRSLRRIVVSGFVGLLMVLSTMPAMAQPPMGFPELTADQWVYDTTGTSLSQAQVADLRQRLRELQAAGADPVVYVRELDATAEETLAQVEALQQAWIRQTGAAQGTAVALLINRNPDDLQDARAGVYAGRTFQEGNIPEDEQRAVVEEALIPPLRDGDVHAALAAGVDRLARSIREGPPRSAFERWAADAAASWLPWVAVGAALVGFAAAVVVFRRRQTSDTRPREPTTRRPGELPPALVAALVGGGPQASAVPATLLDLARRDALAVEPEREGGTFRRPTIRVRLEDRERVGGEVEAALWAALERRADGTVVASDGLRDLAGSPDAVVAAVERRMRNEGWLDPAASASRTVLGVIGFASFALAVFGLVAAAAGGDWWPMSVGIVALGLLAVTTLVFVQSYSRLSHTGQQAAAPWTAYRDGLVRAVKDETAYLDLDAVLPDLVAVGLGDKVKDRLEAASASGQTLRAFTSATDEQTLAAFIPIWVAFTSTVSTGTAAGGGVVSGGGAGGGGGAAGST